MIRKTSSSSHLPVPKTGARRRSKSVVSLREAKSSVAATPVLTSTASSSKKFSTDKYETPILSSQGEAIKKTSLRTPLMTMASSSKKSSASKHATPILSTKGGAIKKTSLWTPLSSALFTSNVTPSSCLYMSRNRSPYKTGSEQHKDWMNEQLAKVLNFLQNRHNCPDSIKQILKPPITIETFVFVINILFKEINPAINVQNVNYKTVVVNTLKMLHYPGNIKNSLLQTVNTKHAWHDVISMFSWLVDLVSTINSVPVQPSEDDDLKRKKIECITDFLTMRYLSYNGTGNREEIDREFGEKFARILKLDQYEINDLKLRVSELRKNEQKKLTKLENKQAKNENLQRKINKMQDEIDTYYENKKEKEDDTKYAIEALKDRRERLQAIFLTKREKVAQLTAVVNKQLYTTADKKRIVQHIDELQHTISLKKESIRVKKTLKDESNIKLAEAKKELLTQIYHFNNRVMKLASIEPVLKQLYLKEKDFWSNEFQSDVEELSKNYDTFKNTFASEICKISSSLSSMNTQATQIKQQKETLQETIENLGETSTAVAKKIEMLDKEMEMLSKHREDSRKNFLRKIASLKETETSLEKNKQELTELTEIHNKKSNDLETKKQRALEFFRNLHDIIVGNLQDMNNIRNEIFEMLKDCLTKVAETEGAILEDLHNLDDVKM